MTEQEITDLIQKINESNETIERQKKERQNDEDNNYDHKLQREVILNSFVNTAQEIYKIIISLSSGAIGVFAINSDLQKQKILYILGLIAFLISILSSIFALILNKKNLNDRWNKKSNSCLEYVITILGNCCIWSFIFGIIMISIILFIITFCE